MTAATAGLERWRENMRAAKAAGLISKFPCGRKPGASRRQRELAAAEQEEALARARVEREDALAPPAWPTRRGGSSLVIDLERVERTLIERLTDRDPPPREEVEEVLGRILQVEELAGRAEGKEERLACLSRAYNDWCDRQALNKLLVELTQERAAARASDDSAPPVALPRPLPAEGTAQVEAAAAEAAEVARLAAEADELITTIKTRLTHSGWPIFDAELDRARDRVRMKASAEGVEATQQALRAAEIDVCERKMEMIRASQENMEAIKARYRAELLQQAEVERARELDPGVPMTMPGWRPPPAAIG